MKCWRIVTKLIVSLALISILLAPFASVKTKAEDYLTPIEKATDSSVSLGSFLSSCSQPLGDQPILVTCIRDILSVVFVVSLLVVIILLTTSSLNVILKGGENASPVEEARKKISDALIGLFLIGAPALILTLFSNTLVNVDLLTPKVTGDIIAQCKEVRRLASEKQYEAAEEVSKDIISMLNTYAPDETLYEANQSYVLSELCFEKLVRLLPSVTAFDQTTTNSQTQATLAGISLVPKKYTYETAQAELDAAYQRCQRQVYILKLYCDVIKVTSDGIVYNYTSNQTSADSALTRGIIIAGEAYQKISPNRDAGDLFANLLITGLKKKTLVNENTAAIIREAGDMLRNETYARFTDSRVRDAHLQRITYVSEGIADLFEDGTVSPVVAGYAFGFVSTFIGIDSPNDDFARIKMVTVETVIDFLKEEDFSGTKIASTGMRLFADAITITNDDAAPFIDGLVRLGEKSMEFASQNKPSADEYFLSETVRFGATSIEKILRNNNADSRLVKTVQYGSAVAQNYLLRAGQCEEEIEPTRRLAKKAKYFFDNPSYIRPNQALYDQYIDQLRSELEGRGIDPKNLTDKEVISYGLGSPEYRETYSSCAQVPASQIFQESARFLKIAMGAGDDSVAGKALDFAVVLVQKSERGELDAFFSNEESAIAAMGVLRASVLSIKTETEEGKRVLSIVKGSLNLAEQFLKQSAQCKRAMEAAKSSPPSTGIISVDWNATYTRYIEGKADEQDYKLIQSYVPGCEDNRSAQLISFGLSTLADLARTLPAYKSNSLVKASIDTVYTLFNNYVNGVKDGLYPRPIVVEVLKTVGDTLTASIQDETQRKTATILANNLSNLVITAFDSQYECERGNQSKCGGITEIGVAKVVANTLKQVVAVQPNSSPVFSTVINTVSKYIDKIERSEVPTKSELNLSILDIGRSIGTTLLNDGDDSNNSFAEKAGKSTFDIAERYLRERKNCEERIAQIQNRIRKGQMRPSELKTYNEKLSDSNKIGTVQLQNPNFYFSNAQIGELEKQFDECTQSQVPAQTAYAAVELLEGYVDAPVPLNELVDLVVYLEEMKAGSGDLIADYRSAQYMLRLFAAGVDKTLCANDNGGGDRGACAAVSRGLVLVNDILQLYVDGKATDAGMLAALFRAGHDLLEYFGVNDPYVEEAFKTADRLFAIWNDRGTTSIALKNRYVGAEMVNFVGAVIPHIFAIDSTDGKATTKYKLNMINTYTQLASAAIATPDGVSPNTAIKATAAFLLSGFWNCDENPNDCDSNVSADVNVLMGIIDATNLRITLKTNFGDSCEESKVPTAPKDSDRRTNDKILAYYKSKEGRDLRKPPKEKCLANPLVSFTASVALSFDKLISVGLGAISSQYGTLGLGENKIVSVLAKVADEIDFDSVVNGSTESIGKALVRNIGYMLLELDVDKLVGKTGGVLVQQLARLPWERIVYEPKSLGGEECQRVPENTSTVFVPPSDRATFAIVGGPRSKGVNAPVTPGKTPACTASVVTNIISRIDFSLVLSSLGADPALKNVGNFINSVVDVVNRMDFSCLGGEIKKGQCHISTATVAKNIVQIFGGVGLEYIVGAKTALFLKNFTAEIPFDVFETGFTFGQMDNYIQMTSYLVEFVGGPGGGQFAQKLRTTYNSIVGLLKKVDRILEDIKGIIKYLTDAIITLEKLDNYGIIDLGELRPIKNTLKQLAVDVNNIVNEIRKVTSVSKQLQKVYIPPETTVTTTYLFDLERIQTPNYATI